MVTTHNDELDFMWRIRAASLDFLRSRDSASWAKKQSVGRSGQWRLEPTWDDPSDPDDSAVSPAG